jgi:PKD domain
MRSSALLATLILLALAFAGCAGDKEGSNGSTTSSGTGSRTSSVTGSTTGASSQTNTTTPSRQNQPPTGSISAVANGTTVSFALNGTDVDGDVLTWNLTFGDGAQANGTDLPAALDHVYGDAGNFTANLTISDGTDNATYSANLTLSGGAASQTVEASWDGPDNAACAGLPYDTVPMSENTYATFVVDAGTWGGSFTADFASFTLQDHLLFLDAAGADLGTFDAGLPATSWSVSGTVPANAALGVFYGCGAAQGEAVTYVAGGP